MHTEPVVGSPLTWARDFAIVGAATASLGPFLVIFHPWFALAAGLAGGASGALLGAALGAGVESGRGRIPLPVWVAVAAAGGSLWGALAGAIGGAAAFGAGSEFEGAAVVLGFLFGGCAGMVQLGWFFLPYLVSATHGRTGPVVLLAIAAAPFMGWAGMAALFASTFGLWLFALPPVVFAAVALDRWERRTRLLENRPEAALDRVRALSF